METLKTKTTLSASELRRKNWVNEEVLGNVIISDIERDGSIWVEAKGLNLQHEPTIEHYHLSKGNFEPIPLSPDILLSAGFEIHSKNSFWTFILPNKWSISMWMEDEPCAGFEKKGVCYYGENYVEVKHLHQLQNLYFALTNCELTITLNQ